VINYTGRASELGDIVNLVDRRRSSAMSIQLSRSKSITRLDDRYAEAKFSVSGVLDNVPEESALIFEDTQISF